MFYLQYFQILKTHSITEQGSASISAKGLIVTVVGFQVHLVPTGTSQLHSAAGAWNRWRTIQFWGCVTLKWLSSLVFIQIGLPNFDPQTCFNISTKDCFSTFGYFISFLLIKNYFFPQGILFPWLLIMFDYLGHIGHNKMYKPSFCIMNSPQLSLAACTLNKQENIRCLIEGLLDENSLVKWFFRKNWKLWRSCQDRKPCGFNSRNVRSISFICLVLILGCLFCKSPWQDNKWNKYNGKKVNSILTINMLIMLSIYLWLY